MRSVRPTVDQSHCYRRDPWGLSAGLPTQAFAQIATPAPPIPELLRVTRTDDNGEGSLRWAIERNNAAPGRFRIEIDPAGQAPYVIKPASALPSIKGPVQIEGAAWKRTGDFIAVDGSGYIEDKGSILKKNKHRWKGELAPLNPFCEAISFGWVGLL